MTYQELERQLLSGKITPEQFIEKYNAMIAEEAAKAEPPQPHEHI